MRIEEVIDKFGQIISDDFSGTKFGGGKELEVLGWAGRKGTHKRYIAYCQVCAEDEELYGDGYFETLKSLVVAGNRPCGCSLTHRKSAQQYEVLIRRVLLVEGRYSFTGWADKQTKITSKSKCILTCKIHGTWDTSGVAQILSASNFGCPKCAAAKISASRKQSDEYMIAKFMATGCFSSGSTFKRSFRLNNKGYATYWDVFCNICNSLYEGHYTNLMSGKVGCKCSAHNYKYCYINLISDSAVPVAIKFGVTKNAIQRVKQQNRSSVYDIKNLGVWEFNSKQDCIIVEKICSNSVHCCILSEADMPDGWTETTFVHNIDVLIDIIEENGGVRVYQNT